MSTTVKNLGFGSESWWTNSCSMLTRALGAADFENDGLPDVIIGSSDC